MSALTKRRAITRRSRSGRARQRMLSRRSDRVAARRVEHGRHQPGVRRRRQRRRHPDQRFHRAVQSRQRRCGCHRLDGAIHLVSRHGMADDAVSGDDRARALLPGPGSDWRGRDDESADAGCDRRHRHVGHEWQGGARQRRKRPVRRVPCFRRHRRPGRLRPDRPSCSEGAPTPAPSNTTAAFRKRDASDIEIDTDANSSDFITGAPRPGNKASGRAPLGTPLATRPPRRHPPQPCSPSL